MKEREESFIEYFFKGDAKWTSLAMIIIAIIILIFEFFRDSSDWWLSMFILFIGVVIVPIEAYMNYKGIWK